MPLVTKQQIIVNTSKSQIFFLWSYDKITMNLTTVSGTVKCQFFYFLWFLQYLACSQLALSKCSCTALADEIISKKDVVLALKILRGEIGTDHLIQYNC